MRMKCMRVSCNFFFHIHLKTSITMLFDLIVWCCGTIFSLTIARCHLTILRLVVLCFMHFTQSNWYCIFNTNLAFADSCGSHMWLHILYMCLIFFYFVHIFFYHAHFAIFMDSFESHQIKKKKKISRANQIELPD